MGSGLPLKGIRVADFSWYGAGPFATKLLAAYGAEVIKIESSAKLDGMRWMGPRKPDVSLTYNISGMYNNFNPGKLGITLNMNHPKGVETAKKLIQISDVVVENFMPMTMEDWGLGYDELVKIKPDIIMVSMPVMGKTGPYSHWRSVGTGILAMAGVNSVTGNPNRPPIGTGLIAWCDWTANPYHAAAAVMAALHYRKKTGKGQFIEIAQLESTACWMGTQLLDFIVNGRIQSSTRNRFPYAAPHGIYRCKGEDREVEYTPMPDAEPQRTRKEERWCAISVFTEEEWKGFCDVIGNPSWTKEERFTTFLGRKQNEDELDRRVEEWTIERSPEEVMMLMQRAGIAAGVVQDGEDLLTRDPQLKERGFYVQLDHPEAGTIINDGMTFILSGTPGRYERAPPLLGEHDEYVYKHILGFSEEEINQLIMERVFE